MIFRIDKKEYLFDNENDPYQLNNLAKKPEYKELKDGLKAEMYGKMDEIGDKFRKNSYYKKN